MKQFNLLLIAVTSLVLSACGMQNQNPAAFNQGFNQGFGGQTGFPIGGGMNQPGGCVPVQNGTFGFSAQGAQMNGAIILAGTLPANSTHPGQYGQVVMGNTMGATAGMIQYQPKQSQSGVIQIMVSPQTGTMTGVVQLYPHISMQIAAMVGGYNPYQPTQNSVCVTSMAFDIVHTTTLSGGMMMGMNTGFINQALVYLTLNSGQTIGPFAFY
jgi:hypothetical protein